MTYTLTIQRQERNPKWDPRQSAQESYGYRQQQEEPQYLVNEQVLLVILTEDEFTAIKRAVLEVIK